MIFKISNSDGRLRIAEIAALTDALGEAASQAYGRRTRRTVRLLDGGGETVDERRAYDRYGRLVEIAASGTTVRYAYDGRGRVARQTVDGTPIDFAYTRDGRLAGKYLGGRLAPEASVEYEYTRDGRIAARTANGVRQAYEYDARGRLLAVKEDGADVERYAYDRAGNMVRKTVRGKTTAFTFDGANQLVSSTTGGVTTRYAYDAAGRLVREGAKTYRYGWLDKVLSVTDGARTYRYDWHADGQLARADYGDGTSESFLWDGLALVRRGGEDFVNEPHAGGGSPVASSKGAVYFNDLLGTTVGVREGRGPLRAKQGDKAPRYTAAALTAFGEPLPGQGAGAPSSGAFFTGKPSVPGLGYAFLLRSYRPDLAKWQTADPFGYPDGWNRLAYCNNGVTSAVDWLGGKTFVANEKEYDDPVLHVSDYLYTGFDASVGMWYRLFQDYDKIVHHYEYDILETENDWIDALLSGISQTANRVAITEALVAGGVLVVLAVSAATGAVPVAIVSYGVFKALGEAALLTGAVGLAGAIASELYEGKQGRASLREHCHETTEKTFNYVLRKEYFE